jgi:hypothetical protein
MEIAVGTMMENHLYQFNRKVYKQREGGTIGLEVIGALSLLGWQCYGTIKSTLTFYKQQSQESDSSTGNLPSKRKK